MEQYIIFYETICVCVPIVVFVSVASFWRLFLRLILTYLYETQKASHWAFLTSAASETLLLFFLSSPCVAMSTFFFSFASFPGKTCPTKTKEERRSEWLCLAALEGFFRGSNIYRKKIPCSPFWTSWRRGGGKNLVRHFYFMLLPKCTPACVRWRAYARTPVNQSSRIFFRKGVLHAHEKPGK